MKHEHRIYFDCSPELAALIQPLLRLPITLRQMERRIMDNIADIKAEQAAQRALLVEVSESVTNAAGDIDDIMARLANADPNAPGTAEVLAEAKTFTAALGDSAAALKVLAGKYTPPTAPPA